jgi:hypothetical protein
MDGKTSIFEDHLLQLSRISIRFAHWWMSWYIRIFNRVYNTMNSETTQKVAFFPLLALQEPLSSF